MSLHDARFYAILDTAYVLRAKWRETAEALIAGGADLVQVRAKCETSAQREALVREILPLFASVGPELVSMPPVPSSLLEEQGPRASAVGGVAARTQGPPLQEQAQRRPILVVNDDVDLCARTAGAGLHIGQDDTPPFEARARIGADRLLGLSTHSWAQAQAAMALPAGVLSYFCVGPLFATQTKPDYPPVGLELVWKVAAARPKLPWFVIGGITRANVAAVVAAGAPRVVVVSDVLLSADPSRAIRDFVEHLPTRAG